MHRLQIKLPPFIYKHGSDGVLHDVEGSSGTQAHLHKVIELILYEDFCRGNRERLEWLRFEQVRTYVLMGFD